MLSLEKARRQDALAHASKQLHITEGSEEPAIPGGCLVQASPHCSVICQAVGNCRQPGE